ncbi:MAG: nuclear transport factor 2 family protein [Cyclobacteriaceae bacterium]|nr:nuclear transport factor 2 family protein [Cyclobacteriaceae bacterium]
MLKYPFLILAMVLTFGASSQDAKSTILQIMERQQACWNQGDIPCFMNGYWESDSLMFVSKEKVYYGYQNTLERYYKGYPNREAMGTLTFTFISMQPLGADAFYVIGSYHLERTIGDAQGHFTLLWKRIEGEWVIVADHSS